MLAGDLTQRIPTAPPFPPLTKPKSLVRVCQDTAGPLNNNAPSVATLGSRKKDCLGVIGLSKIN